MDDHRRALSERPRTAGHTVAEGESPCRRSPDYFEVSWQVIPTALGEMLHDEDDEKSQRVMQAMLQMDKIDIQGLQDAYARQ